MRFVRKISAAASRERWDRRTGLRVPRAGSRETTVAPQSQEDEKRRGEAAEDLTTGCACREVEIQQQEPSAVFQDPTAEVEKGDLTLLSSTSACGVE